MAVAPETADRYELAASADVHCSSTRSRWPDQPRFEEWRNALMPSANTIAGRLRAPWLAAERSQLVIIILAYALALNYAHSDYLNPVWGYFGFSYVQPDLWRYATAAVLVSWGGLIMPARLSQASSAFSIVFGLVIYVPTVVITLGLSNDSLSLHGGLLIAMALAFGAICLPAHLPSHATETAITPNFRLQLFLVAIFLVSCAILFLYFRSSLSIVNFDEVYSQRWRTSTDDKLVSYTLTYFISVICPAIIALGASGATKYRYVLVFMGAVGSIFVYSISAQKMALFYPPCLAVLYFILTSRWHFLRSTIFLALSATITIAFLVLLSTKFGHWNTGIAHITTGIAHTTTGISHTTTGIADATNEPVGGLVGIPWSKLPPLIDFFTHGGWAILYPFGVIFVFFVIHLAKTFDRPTVFRATIATVVLATMALMLARSGHANWLTMLLVQRTIAIPALTLSQYSDFFGHVGWTLWSHVKGLSWFVQPPQALASDANWPNLGMVVGEAIYHTNSDLNANPLASDGVAAAGPVGVALIGCVIGCWLYLLDRVSRDWDRSFAILVLFPVAITMTNAPFFTLLLSFGGLFWLMVFWVFNPDRGWGGKPSFPSGES